MVCQWYCSAPIFEGIIEEEKTYGYCMQDGGTTWYNTLLIVPINALNEVYEDRLWYAESSDWNPCDLYLWGT
jgi:hypothetical protein